MKKMCWHNTWKATAEHRLNTTEKEFIDFLIIFFRGHIPVVVLSKILNCKIYSLTQLN